jgi:hypothetical protein
MRENNRILFSLVHLVDDFEHLQTNQLTRISKQKCQITLFTILMNGSSNEERGANLLLCCHFVDEGDIHKGVQAQKFGNIAKHMHFWTIYDHHSEIIVLLMQEAL